MSKSRVGKCRRVGDQQNYQSWFRKRRERNRLRDRMAKLSRRINWGLR